MAATRWAATFDGISGPRLNLHGLWDREFVERAIEETPAGARGLCSAITAADRDRWRHGTTLDWARESWALSRDLVYPALHAGDVCRQHRKLSSSSPSPTTTPSVPRSARALSRRASARGCTRARPGRRQARSRVLARQEPPSPTHSHVTIGVARCKTLFDEPCGSPARATLARSFRRRHRSRLPINSSGRGGWPIGVGQSPIVEVPGHDGR